MGPLAASASGVALGIALASRMGGLSVALFALLLAALVLGAWRFAPRRTYLLAALCLIAAALGVARAAFVHAGLPAAFAPDVRQRVAYEGVVTGDPDLRDASARIPVTVGKGSAHATVLAVVPRTSAVAVGDRARVTGTLLLPQPFAGDNGRVFAYDEYLAARGVTALVEYGSVRVEREAPWWSLPAALARVKHWFLAGLDRALPEPAASLAGGIVVGGKSGLGTELQDAFTRTGLVQIVVLSGYNVMVVAEWVMAALAFLRVPRRQAAPAGALALLAFVGVAGFSATALRAALMALFALYARATGRSYAAARALAATVLIMLLANPLLLLYDPSFELSVAATAGLIWIAPRIETRLAWLGSPFWQDALATTVAAQLAVLPLLLYETGNLSLVAIPANLLAAPVVPLAMGAAFVAGVVGASAGALWPALAFIAGVPAYLAAECLILLARAFAALPGAAYTIGAFPPAFVPLAYAALAIALSKRASTTGHLRFAKKASIYLGLSAGRRSTM
ncbi:MAG: ComEC/Rec2 family competence protein [Patescibacteria group bacterium]|nr:ComEC/Rec2 family competence protein [Patescibacteria group bacterium]MDE1944076.1 ComEC/Rec2 family competence protein [Patescibacteria group bacterium]MDE1944737.1 ComEC/Rec2 family competence protein [Patescibacteria group bacterium]MDE2057281.1 ComEC/Rec2 family competence protein [Patescibacteria group bacterium]